MIRRAVYRSDSYGCALKNQSVSGLGLRPIDSRRLNASAFALNYRIIGIRGLKINKQVMYSFSSIYYLKFT